MEILKNVLERRSKMEIAFIIGAIIGAIIYAVMQKIFVAHGILRIDHSDPEKDLYRFEIENLDKLNKRSYVELKIDHHADLSQK